MSDTNHQSLQPGDERAYEAMAHAVETNVARLLSSFKSGSDGGGGLAGTGPGEPSLSRYLHRVEDFIERCCRDYAEIMRQCALVPEIRGTPSVLLAKQIRQDVFTPVDAWLNNGNEIRRVYAEKQQQLSPQIIALFREDTKELISELMVACLKSVGQQPERLLDYAAAKCFGAQVSLEHQRQAWESIHAVIAQEIGAAIRLVETLPVAEERLERQQLKAERKRERKQEQRREREKLKPDPGGGLMLMAASVGMVLLSFRSCGISGVGSEDDVLLGFLLFLGAPVVLIYGIAICFDRRRRSAAGGGGLRRPKHQTSPYFLYGAGVFLGSLPASSLEPIGLAWGLILASLLILPGVFLHVRRRSRRIGIKHQTAVG